MDVHEDILAFYNASSEEQRLKQGLGPLEFLRNKELISRYLPAKGGVIADIGGGPGHYAAWLQQNGHLVTLIDPVKKHIQIAQKRASALKVPFTANMGVASDTGLAENSCDVVILHGPLYHLQHRSDRLQALYETHRILKPGGFVLGFAISFTASTLAALQSGLIHQPEIISMCESELTTGIHNPPAAFPGMLSHAYYHRADELKDEFNSAGFTIDGIFAVEGSIWLDQQFFVSWSTSEKRSNLLKLLSLTEQNEQMLALSPHMMLAALKPA